MVNFYWNDTVFNLNIIYYAQMLQIYENICVDMIDDSMCQKSVLQWAV